MLCSYALRFWWREANPTASKKPLAILWRGVWGEVGIAA